MSREQEPSDSEILSNFISKGLKNAHDEGLKAVAEAFAKDVESMVSWEPIGISGILEKNEIKTHRFYSEEEILDGIERHEDYPESRILGIKRPEED